MSMTAAVEQTWSTSRRAAIQAAARLSVDLADRPQVRDLADELARDVSAPDATEREVRDALDHLARLVSETPRT